MTPITLVALDMAGTTVDDHGQVYEALADAVAEQTQRPDEALVQQWMGADKREAIAALLVETGGAGAATEERVEAGFERFRTILNERYAAHPPVALPGVEVALARLRGAGVRVGLTTGFSRDVASALLERLGWRVGASTPLDEATGVLDSLVCSDEVSLGRPAPFMIWRTMEALRVRDVGEVLAAGDTLNDLRAADAAGVRRVGVLTGKLDREALSAAPHDDVIDSVANLPELVASGLTRRLSDVVATTRQ